jgi:hypothetical protein
MNTKEQRQTKEPKYYFTAENPKIAKRHENYQANLKLKLTLPPITTMPERGVYAASSFECSQHNRMLIPARTLKRPEGRAPVWLGPVRPAGEAGDRQSNAYLRPPTSDLRPQFCILLILFILSKTFPVRGKNTAEKVHNARPSPIPKSQTVLQWGL